MFVRQDVHYLLDELRGRHMVTVLGRSDQVVTHFLLVSLLGSILGTARLRGRREKDALHSLQVGRFGSLRAQNKCVKRDGLDGK